MAQHANTLIANPYMSERETEWLISQARQTYRFAEVGCWKGITTANIARNAPNCHVWAIDHFRGSAEHLDPKNKHFEPKLIEEHQQWLREQFRWNTKGLDNVFLCDLDSLVAAYTFPLGWFNTVFIDASHDAESVELDIDAWLPRVAKGGMLCGHDIMEPGVLKAVEDFFFEIDMSLRCFGLVKETSIWVHRKGA